MVASALASSLGRRVAGRSAAASSTARAGFGRSLVSALESVRTVKLAAATPQRARATCAQVDGGRVDAAVREHRVQALLDGVPVVMVQCGVVAAWGGLLAGEWELATALLVANAVSGFDWFGRVAGSVVTEAPGVRAWMQATSRLAGGGDLMDLPRRRGPGRAAPAPRPAPGRPRAAAHARRCAASRAVHDDGTVGVQRRRPDASAPASWCCCSARSAPASRACSVRWPGWSARTGEIRWNGELVDDPQTCCAPAGSPTWPRCRACCRAPSPTTSRLDHPGRVVDAGARDARGWAATSPRPAVPTRSSGHRGVRLSGGQVQRLALARALACDAELLLADDVSSALDAATEVELWQALRARRRDRHRRDAQGGRTGAGRPGRRARRRARRRPGPWAELSPRWGHLAGLSRPRALCRRGWVGGMRVVIAGASGFPRHPPDRAPARRGATRSPSSSAAARRPATESRWDPYAGHLDQAVIDRCRRRGQPRRRRASPATRTRGSGRASCSRAGSSTTRLLAEAIAESRAPPAFLASNGIAYYGDHGAERVTEESDSRGDAFLTRVTREWQEATAPGREAGARVCVLRTAPVMDRGIPPLKQLRSLPGSGWAPGWAPASSTSR